MPSCLLLLIARSPQASRRFIVVEFGYFKGEGGTRSYVRSNSGSLMFSSSASTQLEVRTLPFFGSTSEFASQVS